LLLIRDARYGAERFGNWWWLGWLGRWVAFEVGERATPTNYGGFTGGALGFGARCNDASGGAAGRRAFALARLGIEYVTASRTLEGRGILWKDPLVNPVPRMATGALNLDHGRNPSPDSKILAHPIFVRSARMSRPESGN
jgi:hypothetical protein